MRQRVRASQPNHSLGCVAAPCSRSGAKNFRAMLVPSRIIAIWLVWYRLKDSHCSVDRTVRARSVTRVTHASLRLQKFLHLLLGEKGLRARPILSEPGKGLSGGGSDVLLFFSHNCQQLFRLHVRQWIRIARRLHLELVELHPLAEGLLVVLVLRIAHLTQERLDLAVSLLLFCGQRAQHLSSIRGSTTEHRSRHFRAFHLAVSYERGYQ